MTTLYFRNLFGEIACWIFSCFLDEMVSIRGKINGILNEIKIVDMDTHAFIHTLATDSRNYILAKYPKELSNKATYTLLFATPIHWLFAGSSNDESTSINGFSLTGYFKTS